MDVSISIGMIILAVIVLVVIGIIAKNVQVVPQSSCRIIERLGKYKATWQAGLHVKVPFIDNVVVYYLKRAGFGLSTAECYHKR